MGLSRTISLPNGEPTWDSLASRLKALGETPQLRMIDGLPAFPDETPPDNWRELRVTLSAGMVTIQRDLQTWTLVTWGNADPGLEASQERLIQAIQPDPGS
jgi:hypothetical protein